MTTQKRKWIRWESGQGMVEFALVLPLFIAICFFCMDMAWFFTCKNSLNQLTESMVYEIKQPQGADWDDRYGHVRHWKTAGTPTWLFSGEDTDWSSKYSGWLPFDFLGPGFGFYSYDMKNFYEDRVKAHCDVLEWDEISYHMDGGWYLKNFSEYLPMQVGTGYRALPRTSEYFADVRLELWYDYKPLTIIGDVFLCGNTGSRRISAKIAVNYPQGAHLSTY